MFLERWTVVAMEKSECWLLTMKFLKRIIMQDHEIERGTRIAKRRHSFGGKSSFIEKKNEESGLDY
jgi:hypothetical protein